MTGQLKATLALTRHDMVRNHNSRQARSVRARLCTMRRDTLRQVQERHYEAGEPSWCNAGGTRLRPLGHGATRHVGVDKPRHGKAWQAWKDEQRSDKTWSVGAGRCRRDKLRRRRTRNLRSMQGCLFSLIM